MESLKISTRDNLQTELRDMLRIETRTRAPMKIRGDFYTHLQTVVFDLKKELDEKLESNDIKAYMQLGEQIKRIEADFKAFFEKRFEKIAMLSIFVLEQDLLSRLTVEEKAALAEYHALAEKYFTDLKGAEQ